MSHFFRAIVSSVMVFQVILTSSMSPALAQELSESVVEPPVAVVEEPVIVEDPVEAPEEIVSEPSVDPEEEVAPLEVDEPDTTNQEEAVPADLMKNEASPEEGDDEEAQNEAVDDEQNIQIDQNVQDIEELLPPEPPKALEFSDVMKLLDDAFRKGSLYRGDASGIRTFLQSLEISEEMIRDILVRFPARNERDLKQSPLRVSTGIIPPGLLKKTSLQRGINGQDIPTAEGPVEFVSERILVQVDSMAAADRLIAQSVAEQVEVSVLLEGGQPLLRIDALDGTSTIGLLQRYLQDPAVVYQEPDYVYRTDAVPNDSTYPFQWHHKNTGGSYAGFSGSAGEDIQSQDAWDIFTGNGNTIVAVIDTGVQFNHPDLQNRMWNGSAGCVDQNGASIVGGCPYHGFDYFDLDNNPIDESNHGTLVAGSFAAHGNNGVGVAGVNWNGRIMALKTGTAQSSALSGSAIVNSVYFAVRNGAKILNMSFSSSGESLSLTNAINFARTNNVLVLVAAGNNSLNLDIPGQNAYPCETNLDNIVCIASTNVQGTLQFLGGSSTSNYGATTVDIAAPGSLLVSTAPVQTDLYVNGFENGVGDVNQFILSGGSGWGLKDTGTNKLLTTHTSGSYGNNESTFAEINQNFNLSGYQSGTLILEMSCLTENTFDGSGFPLDGVAIDFSHDGGVTYQEAVSFNGALTTLSGQFSVGPNGLPLITVGLINTDFVNQFRFRFHFFSNSSVTGTGCDIDEVRLRVTSGSTYLFASGTSFATPVVAGLASLIWEFQPSMTYQQVIQQIIAGGEALPALSGTTVTGKRVNAYRSLALLTNPAVVSLRGFLSDGGSEFIDGTVLATDSPFFSWTAPAGQGIISGYSYAVDGVPDNVVDTSTLSAALSALGQGSHTFQVSGINDQGVTGTAAFFNFTVDTIAPDAPSLLSLNGNNVVNGSNESSSSITGSASEAALLQFTISDGTNPDVLGNEMVASGAFTIDSIDLRALNEGPLTLTAFLIDGAGNVSTGVIVGLTKDTLVNVPTNLKLNDSLPIVVSSPPSVDLAFDTTEAGSANYTIANGLQSDVTGSISIFGAGTSIASIDHSSLSDSTFNISVIFTDSAGNIATAATTTLVKDTQVSAATNVQLNAGGVNAANQASSSLSFGAPEPGTANYVISDGVNPSLSGTAPVSGAGTITVNSLNVSGLNDGTLSLSVVFTDAVGNIATAGVGSAQKDVTVQAATNVQLHGGVMILAVDQNAVDLTFSTTETGSATYIITDGSAPNVSGSISVSGAGVTTVQVNVSSLDDGTLNLSIVFTDSVGNVAAAGVGTVQKDATVIAPSNVQLNGGATVSFANKTAVDLTFETLESGTAAYAVSDGLKPDVEGFITVTGAGTSTVQDLDVSSLADGTLNLSVVLTDTPGNISSTGIGTVSKDTIVDAATAVTLNGGSGVNAATAANSSLMFTTTEAGTANYIISNGVAPDLFGSTPVSGSGVTSVIGLDVSGFGDGFLNLSVQLTDSVGNLAPAGLGTSAKDVLVSAATNVQLNSGITINASKQSSVGLTFETTESGSALYTISDGVHPSLSGTESVLGSGLTTVPAINVGSLNNGTLTLSVVFTDSFGNEAAAGTGSVLKDSDIPVAPDGVLLNGGVTINSSSVGSVEVSGTVAEAGSLLYAIVDSASGAVNGSQVVSAGAFTIPNVDVRGLSDGTLTLYVTLTDDAGNTSLDGNSTVLKDVQISAATNVQLNGGVMINAAAQASVALVFATTESGSAEYTISDGTNTVSAVVAVNGSGITTVSNIDVSSLADGTLDISVVFTDMAGNMAAAGLSTLGKDSVVPQAPQAVLLNGGVTILQSAQGSVNLTGTVGEAGTLEYIISDGLNVDMNGSQAVAVGAFTISALNVSGLNDGTLTVSARVTDAAGNVSTYGTSNVVKDSQVSSVTNVALNGNVTINAATQTSVSLVFNTTESGSASYLISDGSAPHLTGVVAVTGAGATTLSGLNVSGLDDGTLNISVVFTDTPGNAAAPTLASLLKDTQVSAPQTIALNNQVPLNISNVGSVSLTGSVAESGTLASTISDGTSTISGTASVGSGNFNISAMNLTSLSDGVLVVTVTLTDTAGNVSSASQVGLLKDTVITDPTGLVLLGGQPVTSANATSISIAFNVSESGAAFYSFTDGVNTVAGSRTIAAGGAQTLTGIDVSSLAEGTITLSMSFQDDVGNIAGNVGGTVLKDTIANTPTSFVVNGGQAINLANLNLIYFRTTLSETGSLNYSFTDGIHTISGSVPVTTVGTITVSNIDLTSMNEGTIMAAVTFTDELGNVSLTVPGTVVKDTIVSSAAQVVLNAGSPVTAAGASSVALTFVVSETGTALYTITDENNAVVSGTVSVATVGFITVTLNVSSLANGILTPAVTFTDAVGNGSTTILGPPVQKVDVLAESGLPGSLRRRLELQAMSSGGGGGSSGSMNVSASQTVLSGAVARPEAPLEMEKPEEQEAEIVLPFVDLSDADESYESVAYLYGRGIVQGQGTSARFDSRGVVDWAQALKILLLVSERELPSRVTSSPFPAVETDAWFAPYFSLAKRLGFVKGDSQGQVIPWQAMNRAEAVVLAYRVLEREADSVEVSSFADVEAGVWFSDALHDAVQRGFVGTREDGLQLFADPTAPITREEFVRLVVALWLES